MNDKKLLITVVAAVVVVVIAIVCLVVGLNACQDTPDNDTTTPEVTTDGDNIVTDDQGNTVTDDDGNPVTKEPEEVGTDPSEENPTFVDKTMKVAIYTYAATIRTSTDTSSENGVAWPAEQTVLDVTGESDNWYRISYKVNGEPTTCYIAKSVVADAAILDTFTAVEGGEEEVIIDGVTAANVRSFPTTESDKSIRFTLKEGEKVIRTAVSENWSRIKCEVEEERTNEDGETEIVVVTKEYYVNNVAIKAVDADTTTTTAAAQ